MLERSQNSYPILRAFREFYAEVARLRQVVEERTRGEVSSTSAIVAAEASPVQPVSVSAATGAANASVAVAERGREDITPSDETWDDIVTRRVWGEMALYLDQKMYEVKLAASSLSHDLQEELVYLMAAFADETFVCLLEWPGKDYWREHLMEVRLFRSQIADQNIFRRIDILLARQDFGTEELAAVYLMALALGFRGQFLRDPASVDGYRRKLFDRLLMTDPDLRRRSHQLFPEAYLYTVAEGSPVRLPEPKKWWLVVAAVVGAWLVFSSVAWIALTISTRKWLYIAMNSLDRITSQQPVAVGTSEKWIVLPFAPQNGGFQLELPANIPIDMAGTTSTSLLVGVQGVNGYSAGSTSQVEAWLSTGETKFPAGSSDAAGKTRNVTSVVPMNTPPNGVTASRSTLYFLVNPTLQAQDLALHPQLTFSPPGGYGLAVASVMLCIPQQPSQSIAGAP